MARKDTPFGKQKVGVGDHPAKKPCNPKLPKGGGRSDSAVPPFGDSKLKSKSALTIPLVAKPCVVVKPKVKALLGRDVEWVTSEVSAHPVVIFSKSWCPHCTTAKDAIAKLTTEFVVHSLDLKKHSLEQKLQDALEGITSARTVPRVFIGGKCVGGGDDVAMMSKNGELKAKLVAAGVELVQPPKPKKSTKSKKSTKKK